MRWTTNDLPRPTGRSSVVTDANSGLGFITARELARGRQETARRGTLLTVLGRPREVMRGGARFPPPR
ncbi:hypothetical protein ACFYZB_20295 [Streptomyces sp. NPDC001852]|uniref:hypothetical protein n=1 Tax=Streptomyces sp. NPDC001852 TaxID=3364619 RepID=UPI0036ACCACF